MRDNAATVMSSVLEAIGNTPLVELSRLTRGVTGRILLKLDYLNPGFSKKDRAALGILVAAERAGALRAGQTVVELTSGNMGTGLAIVCASAGRRRGNLRRLLLWRECRSRSAAATRSSAWPNRRDPRL